MVRGPGALDLVHEGHDYERAPIARATYWSIRDS